jgi:hypothetical protein
VLNVNSVTKQECVYAQALNFEQVPSSDVASFNHELDLGKQARSYNTKGLKKRARRLSRNPDRHSRDNKKRTSFDHSEYRASQGDILRTNPDSATPPIARSLSNRGHSPTKAEVKKMNQCLIDENQRLKKDFHKAEHRLKTLLANKKDLLR